MPKISKAELDTALIAVEGEVFYFRSESREAIKHFRKQTGITKGQWKRFHYMLKAKAPCDWHLVVNNLTLKKLKALPAIAGTSHVETLLKIIEVRHGEPDEHD